MSEMLHKGIVRIRRESDQQVVGAGFLVDDTKKIILTCAHVINAAIEDHTNKDKPRLLITLDFPFIDTVNRLDARVTNFFPKKPDNTGDIAVLEILDDLPANVEAVQLATTDNYSEDEFAVYGFPIGLEANKQYVEGKLQEKLVNEHIQVVGTSNLGYFEDKGFGGSPVYDKELDAVVGMVMQVDVEQEERVALICTPNLIEAVYPNVHYQKIKHKAKSAALSSSSPSKSTWLQRVDIFISSPSDVAEEREAILRVIERLNRLSYIRSRYVLNPLLYEKEVPPEAGDYAQMIVNRYMAVEDSYLLVCLMWNRMGTPFTHPKTGEEFQSGTEYEFTVGYRANGKNGKPHLLLYRKTAEQSSIDESEKGKVDSFFKQFEEKDATFKGLYKNFSSMNEFENMVFMHIERILHDNPPNANRLDTQIDPDTRPDIVEEVRRLDAAMPSECQVRRSTEVRVMICLPDSEGLRALLPDTTAEGDLINKSNVEEGNLAVAFPLDKQTAKPKPIIVSVELHSTDFTFTESVQEIQLSPKSDSGQLIFSAMPIQSVKRARIHVIVKSLTPDGYTVTLGSASLITLIKQDHLSIATSALWSVVSLPFAALASGFSIGTHKHRELEELEIAMSQYQQALSHTSNTQDRHFESDLRTYNAIQGDKAENIDTAIEAYKQALTIQTQITMPTEWSQTMMALGNVYAKHIQGDKAQNIKTAIAIYKQALNILPKAGNEQLWSALQSALGNALKRNYQGDWGKNIEEALAAYEQALTVQTPSIMPIEWAQTMMNRGNAYRNRIKGNKAENIEEAIQSHKQALSIQTPRTAPVAWADTMNSIGNAYKDRIRGNRAENIELAINAYNQALSIRTKSAMPTEWAQTMMNLGNAYAERIRGDRAENLEVAINAYKQALGIRTQDTMPVAWGITMMNLGNAYRNRIKGNKAENIEEAIQALGKARPVMKQNAMLVDWATITNNLGNACAERILGDKAKNIEAAIATYNQALSIRTQDTMPVAWAQTMVNLGTAYSERIQGDKAENIEMAIDKFEQALSIRTQDTMPVAWAATKNNLATAYRNRIRGDKTENIELAIAAYQQALTVRTPIAFPADHRQTQRNLGNLYFAEERWSEAERSYAAAIEVGNDLLAAAFTDTGRRAEISETAMMYVNAAYCQLQQNHPDNALVQLEAGKTRLLTEALALADAKLENLSEEQRDAYQTTYQMVRELEGEYRLPPNSSKRRDDRTLAGLLKNERAKLREFIQMNTDFMPKGLKLPDILRLIPEGGALVAPLFTSMGSVVFVIPHGTQTISEYHIILLGNFSTDNLNELLVGTEETPGWLRAYIDFRNSTKWYEFLNEYTRKLWDVLVGKIYAKLDALDIKPESDIILMPQGGLGLLPLHSAQRQVDGEPRFLLDDYVIHYTPSANALTTAQRRLNQLNGNHTALIAGVSQYGNLPNLPNTTAEAAAIAVLFGVQPLLDSAASRTAIIETAPGKAYLHLACHGAFAWGSAFSSALFLTNDEPLTLSEIMSKLDLDKVRLVTLSACETGITDVSQSPDEYLGLPAGFMQAGAPGVVSSLWTVANDSTKLLMEYFYQFHLQDGLEPAAALRKAQLWLRDNTEYTDPFFWAAFTTNGV